MFKALKSQNVVIPTTNNIRVSYNNEKCYKCNRKDNLIPVVNDGSVSYCKTCNIQVLLFEFIEENEYKKKTGQNVTLSRLYNPSHIKRENFITQKNHFI
jgi:hypothetical protein